MTETSATEELRRLLDERSVHWWEGEDERKTHWVANGLTWEYFNDENDDAWLGFLGACEQDITPEQAIAVTLWSGVERSRAEYATLERIAELEELESGVECEVVQGKNGPKCSNCGKELPEDPYSDYEGNFCPTCGARVRGDAE